MARQPYVNAAPGGGKFAGSGASTNFGRSFDPGGDRATSFEISRGWPDATRELDGRATPAPGRDRKAQGRGGAGRRPAGTAVARRRRTHLYRDEKSGRSTGNEPPRNTAATVLNWTWMRMRLTISHARREVILSRVRGQAVPGVLSC